MASPPVLAWRQLSRERLRLLVAIGGVSFAVVLMLMQLGFQDAMFISATRLHRVIVADLVLTDREAHALQSVKPFDRTALYQTLGHPDVASVAPLYLARNSWKNPYDFKTRSIFVVGFNVDDIAIDLPAVNENRAVLKVPENVLFDSGSRREFGPVAADLLAGRPVATEIGTQRVFVKGLYFLGASFVADGSVICSDETFFRIMNRDDRTMDIGLIKLKKGADPEAVRASITRMLPAGIIALTKAGFIAKEELFWKKNTAIGFIFGFGVIIGFLVGAIIVYQILYADVSDHLAEYATLKAIGYKNSYLFGVVLGEASLLSVLGFLPGALISTQLYKLSAKATNLPMVMRPGLWGIVFILTVVMCVLSGAIAVRKVQSADPADVF